MRSRAKTRAFRLYGVCAVSPSPEPVASATAKPSTSRACALRPIGFHHALEGNVSAARDGGEYPSHVLLAKSQMWLLRPVGAVSWAAQETMISSSPTTVFARFRRMPPAGAAAYVAATVATPRPPWPHHDLRALLLLFHSTLCLQCRCTPLIRHICLAMLPMSCPCWK